MQGGSKFEEIEPERREPGYSLPEPEGARPVLSIIADAALHGELCEDALACGLRVGRVEALEAMLAEDLRALGDVVLVECRVVDAAMMAGLMRLDMRAARIGVALVVITSLEALDTVFGCLDQSNPQILVGSDRAERVLALGRARARLAGGVRDLSDSDRAMLIRLGEQVSELGVRLEKLRQANGDDSGPLDDRDRLADKPWAFRFGGAAPLDRVERTTSSQGMPSPEAVRGMIRRRQLRGRFLPAALFADPAWDMLLDLAAARGENARVSVTSLCIASGVPATTALRWIAQMTGMGLLRREVDVEDRRRAFIALSDTAAGAMACYFAAAAEDFAPTSRRLRA